MNKLKFNYERPLSNLEDIWNSKNELCHMSRFKICRNIQSVHKKWTVSHEQIQNGKADSKWTSYLNYDTVHFSFSLYELVCLEYFGIFNLKSDSFQFWKKLQILEFKKWTMSHEQNIGPKFVSKLTKVVTLKWSHHD